MLLSRSRRPKTLPAGLTGGMSVGSTAGAAPPACRRREEDAAGGHRPSSASVWDVPAAVSLPRSTSPRTGGAGPSPSP